MKHPRRSSLSRYGNAAAVWVKIDRTTYTRRGWFVRQFPGHPDWTVIDDRGAFRPGIPDLAAAKAVVDKQLGPVEVSPSMARALRAAARERATPSDITKLEAAGLVETYRYYKSGFRHESRGVKLTTRGRTLVANLGDRRRRS